MFSTFLGRTTVASTSAQELRGVVHIALERLPEVANNNLALFSGRSLLMFLHTANATSPFGPLDLAVWPRVQGMLFAVSQQTALEPNRYLDTIWIPV